MAVEFISATHTTPSTEATAGGRRSGFDVDYTRRFVRALDDGGFDWTLVAYGSPTVDALQLSQFVVNNSERVKPMLAHRPGFVFPTQAAKAFATIDQIGKGRLGIHMIAGGDDHEQQREGDYTTKAERYERTDEFIQLLRRIWSAEGPIDHEGKYYRFADFQTDIKPYQDTIPISVGGSSDDAYRVGGQQGDIFGLWGEPLAETAQQIATVNSYADAAGRAHPRIWISFRPIVAATDDLAWEKAHEILAQTQKNAAGPQRKPMLGGTAPQNVGSQRLLELAGRGELHDRALWTPLVTATGAGGSTTALVGSYETVAQALLDYVDIGCELLSIRGWDPLNDAIDYARYVLPLVRQELANRPVGKSHRQALMTRLLETRLPDVDISDDALAALTQRLAGTAERYDRSADFPWEPIQAVHDAGILRLGIGAPYGGTSLSTTDTARVLQALGKGDPSVALLTAMTVMQHGMQAKNGWWPDDLYRKVVRDSLDRPVLINAIRAEPELGAPARGGLPATTVQRTSNGWLLNGHKGFGTGSEGLAYHAVWAATNDKDPLLGHVIVPGDTEGIAIVKTWDHLGLRASSTHDVLYRDVEVPESHFRGVPASQQSNDPSVFATAALGLSGLYLGVARAAQDFFVQFANERVPTALGRPIATTERIQSVAGEIEAQLVQAEEVLYGLAARIDAGDGEAGRRALVAKLLITRSAIGAVQIAVAALGNPALSRHNSLERHWRNVQCSRIHPPQDDTALIGAGRASLARYVKTTTAENKEDNA